MAEAAEVLIARLAADLRPVRRLRPPGLRAMLWAAAALAFGVALATRADMGAVEARMMAVPDMRLAALGAVATALGAVLAAFQASVPGRSAAWSLLPLPGAILWLGASGMGCMRPAAMPGLEPPDPHEMMGCAGFIVLVSVPLSALLLWMLRRAAPLHPARVAVLGGLAAAAAANSLLTLFHPHDVSVLDILVHTAAVLVVILSTRAWGRRALSPRPS